MNELIVLTAKYLLYVLVVVAGVVWLTRNRTGKLAMAGAAILGLALVGIGILLAAALHTDPRPFVHDPHSTPLFSHAADNGFPSDHSVAGGLLAALVFRFQRWIGVLVFIGACLVGAARVAAHVHHGQDVVAGLLIGLIGGGIAVGLVELVLRARRRSALG